MSNLNNIIKNSIKKLIMVSSLVTILDAANLPTCCEPLMSDVQWAGVAQHKIDFKRIAEIIDNSLKFIPAVPKPYVNGEITFKTFKKEGCCS